MQACHVGYNAWLGECVVAMAQELFGANVNGCEHSNCLSFPSWQGRNESTGRCGPDGAVSLVQLILELHHTT